MKRVLVLGGCGFIGTSIKNVLLDKNYKFGIYDIDINGNENTGDITFYSGDVINDNGFEDILSEYDVLIYLLSSIMPRQSMDNPVEAYSTDIPLLLRVLEMCCKSGVKRVIYSSSGGAVYGEHNDPNSEDLTIPNPQNHYAICKLTCEKILLLYNKLYNMENIILRVANPYGLNQRVASGVGAIAAFADKILRDEPITVFGDGENTRDFIPVECVAEAFSRFIEWKADPMVSPIFNVGSGEGLSLNRIIGILSEEFDKKPIVKYIESREYDLKTSVLEMSKTEKYIGKICDMNAEAAIREYCSRIKK